MDVTKKSRLQLRLQNLIFYIGFLSAIGLLAYLSNKYNFDYDLTASNKHTLSEASIKVLQRMPNNINIRVFVRSSDVQPTRKIIAEKLAQYTRIKNDINIDYINPDTNPDVIRKLGIKVDGEIIIEYNNRSEHLQYLSEELLTNSLLRLLRSNDKQILFVTGHGERRPNGDANYDLKAFTSYLNKTGIKTNTIDLNQTPIIPSKAAALVIASPQIDYLPGEVKIINDYINAGGNVLWLHEPGLMYGLEALANNLQLKFEPGTVVDPSAQLYGISSPTISIVTQYGSHAITKDFALITVFPQAVALNHSPPNNNAKASSWKSTALLKTVARSWSETGVLQGSVEFSADNDIPGPLNLGIALSRAMPNAKPESNSPKKQRIVVLGDGDFLSNTYIGNQGNRDLGVNIFNWISHDDNFISIPSKTAIDTKITLNQNTWWILALLLLIILPLALAITGFIIWRKRTKK
ncbi:MAG: GldG family protein [Gammaproteobacteria bacterium]